MSIELKDCGIYIPVPIPTKNENKVCEKDCNDNDENHSSSMITKLRMFDFFCKNEIDVCSILEKKRCEREKKYFQLLKKIRRVQFMNQNYEKNKNNKDMDYNVIMMYKHCANEDTLLNIRAFFSQPCSSLRLYKHTIISSFKNLLSAVQVLEEECIVFPRLSEDCVCIDKKTGDILLSNLNKSLLMNEERKRFLINNINSTSCNQNNYQTGYTVEQYILRYMNENELISLSAGNIDEVVMGWSSSLSIVEPSIKEELKDCFISLINQSRATIFSRILELSNTWTSYGLCVLYFYFIQQLIHENRNDIFLQRFSRFLRNEIEKNPFQRRGSKYLLECFDTLIYGIKREEWV